MRRRRSKPSKAGCDEDEEMNQDDLEEEMTSLMNSIEPQPESTYQESFMNVISNYNSTNSCSAAAAAAAPAVHFNSLPDDALLHIFSYLTDIRDLIYVSCVTRRWRSVALSRSCIFTVLSNRLGRKVASGLVNNNGNANDNKKELSHVVALQKVYEAQRCWDKLELISRVFELLSRPPFIDLYPGEALCTVDIIPPYDESARVVYENHGPTRSRRHLQNVLMNCYKTPIQDLINPECDLSRPPDTFVRPKQQKKPYSRNIRARGARQQRDEDEDEESNNKRGNYDDTVNNQDDQAEEEDEEGEEFPEAQEQEEIEKAFGMEAGKEQNIAVEDGGEEEEEEEAYYEKPSSLLPVEVLMHYKLHNGIQLHLESYPPPKTYQKDGTGLTAATEYDMSLDRMAEDEEEALQAFPHYDFILYPVNSAGIYRIYPLEWFDSVPKWLDDKEGPIIHIGRHGTRHYVATRPSGEVVIFSWLGYDPSRVRCRTWPRYHYRLPPLGIDELVGVYPSLTSYLQRSVCPEVEKGLINLAHKIIDIWNAKRRVSVGEAMELTGLLTSVKGDHSPLLIEKAKKKLSAGKTAVISTTSQNNKPVRMLLAGSHTPFPVRTYRDRYVKIANKQYK